MDNLINAILFIIAGVTIGVLYKTNRKVTEVKDVSDEENKIRKEYSDKSPSDIIDSVAGDGK